MKVFVNTLLYPLHKAMQEGGNIKLEQRLHRSWRRSEATWRKMFWTQPATIVEVCEELEFIAVNEDDLTYAAQLPEHVAGVHERAPHLSSSYWVDATFLWSRLNDNMQLEMLPAERSKDDDKEGEFDDGL